MSKVTKNFVFEMPISKQQNVNGTIQQVHTGDLVVSATVDLSYSDEPDISYNSIKWAGTDILPLLDNMNAADDIMQAVTNAAYNHVLNTFTPENLMQN